jgi:NAD(P)-dependent dehydrogenase (short-subunit alcohol dehydrogenase family)
VNPPSNDEIETCLRVLVELGSLAQSCPDDERVLTVRQASAGLVKAARRTKRATYKAGARRRDSKLVSESFVYSQPTEERTLSAQRVLQSIGEYSRPRRCYVCKQLFIEINSLYHGHCLLCAEHDRSNRDARADLTGRRAVITGGRIKIGFHLALKMLRDGAEVIVTTRFPVDSRMRFEAVSDSSSWIDRLTIYGLDLCDISGLETFIKSVQTSWDWLDIVVFNAASTVRRQPAYYAREIALNAGVVALPSLGGRADALVLANQIALPKDSSQRPDATDETGEVLDLSERNSWVLKLGEVDRREVLENYLVGGFSVFEMLGAFIPQLEASPNLHRHVIIVSAMEGQFAKRMKLANHPHTNMTKAAANMLVRTCADDLATKGVYMNAVDTGWINDENPHLKKESIRERGFRPPLDVVDGAARIYHPIRVASSGQAVWGKFLKDYESAPW